jgi:hypothetical protein
MAQQTALEWLINHWKKLQSEGEKMNWSQIIQITELAKKMEKQQMMDAWINGNNTIFPGDLERKKWYQEYYTETYGK